MNWQSKQVSLYSTNRDTLGRPAASGSVLLSDFGRDIHNIVALRNLDPTAEGYKVSATRIKDRLQCFSPSALLATREKDKVDVIERTGLMQLDFDYASVQNYDIEELKACVFSLPFIAFVGLSCSGLGFYALAAIAEPERLLQYAEHCFRVFESYGIKVDTSKGRNPQDLRYVSYDANMLIRDEPEVLRIPAFKPKQAPIRQLYGYSRPHGEGIVKNALNKVKNAIRGARFPTIQNVAYTLGGIGGRDLLEAIKTEIANNPEFEGEHPKYFKCADDCFADGILKPLSQSSAINGPGKTTGTQYGSG